MRRLSDEVRNPSSTMKSLQDTMSGQRTTFESGLWISWNAAVKRHRIKELGGAYPSAGRYVLLGKG